MLWTIPRAVGAVELCGCRSSRVLWVLWSSVGAMELCGCRSSHVLWVLWVLWSSVGADHPVCCGCCGALWVRIVTGAVEPRGHSGAAPMLQTIPRAVGAVGAVELCGCRSSCVLWVLWSSVGVDRHGCCGAAWTQWSSTDAADHHTCCGCCGALWVRIVTRAVGAVELHGHSGAAPTLRSIPHAVGAAERRGCRGGGWDVPAPRVSRAAPHLSPAGDRVAPQHGPARVLPCRAVRG